MIFILKSIFKNYPDKNKQDKILLIDKEKRKKSLKVSHGLELMSNHTQIESAKELAVSYNQYDMQNIIKY